MDELRQVLLINFHLILPTTDADLLSGIVLGEKNFDPVFYDLLKVTGLVHVVVVSGYNISVVAGLTLHLLKSWHRVIRALLTSLLIIFYIALTGGSAPAVRAGIMGILALGAKLSGREYLALYGLGLSALLMTLFDPNVLGELSFQLSFAATLGIIVFEKPFYSLIKLPELFKSTLSTTLAAQVLVVPLILYNFGTISLISPLANMLTLWIIPLLTYLGFIIALLSLIYLPLAAIVAWLSYLFSSLFISAIYFFASIPGAQIVLGRKAGFSSLLLFMIILSLAVTVKRRASRLSEASRVLTRDSFSSSVLVPTVAASGSSSSRASVNQETHDSESNQTNVKKISPRGGF